MLDFQQMMWTVESEYPNAYKFSTSGELKQGSVWCDQPGTEGYLAEAWTARRTDDWSFFERKIARARLDGQHGHASDVGHLLMHSLNHLLLYSGPGWHPLLSLDSLAQDEHPLVGGFTLAFKKTWQPYIQPLQTFWRWNGFAPHFCTDTNFENVVDLRNAEAFPFGMDEYTNYVDEWKRGDGLHLRSHSGVPVGKKWDEFSELPRRFEDSVHESGIVTVEGLDYAGWMRHLRDLDLDCPEVLVKYNIDNELAGISFTLGHFLLTNEVDSMRTSANRVCFLTDDQVPLILDRLVGGR